LTDKNVTSTHAVYKREKEENGAKKKRKEGSKGKGLTVHKNFVCVSLRQIRKAARMETCPTW